MRPNLLLTTFEFLRNLHFFDDRWILDWTQKLIHLYDRGWLYAAMRGNDLLAVAGAYRIPQWDDRYLESLPEREEGDTLFIPLFATNAEDPSLPLKLWKQFLRKNPDIHRVVYYRKKRDVKKCSFDLPPRNASGTATLSDSLCLSSPKRMFIAPPEWVALF